MARTSFPASMKAYLDAMRPFYQPSSLERYRRDLRTIYRDLKALREDRKVRTLAPSTLSEADVEALLARWRTRPSKRGTLLDPASQEKLIAVLGGFLDYWGNPVLRNLRRKRYIRFPRALKKPIRVLDSDELDRLQIAAEGIDGWPGFVARFLVGFLPACGLRPNEIRLARLKDLEIAKGRILVAHPKGEGAWAAADYAPVPTFARAAAEDFLGERSAFLAGEPCEWLIPYRRPSGEIGPWSAAMLRKLKAELSRRTGVAFSLKTFRATFAQRAIDGGARVEAASRAMRHASTKTTEAFYARIRADDAFHEIEKAFSHPRIRLEPQGDLPKSPAGEIATE